MFVRLVADISDLETLSVTVHAANLMDLANSWLDLHRAVTVEFRTVNICVHRYYVSSTHICYHRTDVSAVPESYKLPCSADLHHHVRSNWSVTMQHVRLADSEL